MSDSKMMNFFVVLMVTWHYTPLFGSPFAQNDDYIYYDYAYDTDFCMLPPELGHAGKI